MSNIHKSWLIFLVTYTNAFAGTLIQLQDYLCGCDYCDTVNPQEPLDIAGHMMRCHSQRTGMIKTMRIMEELKRDRVAKEEEMKRLELAREEAIRPQQEHTTTYTWKEDELLGHVYSSSLRVIDQWIYTEEFEWVWYVSDLENFLYSYEHGWLYITRHQWFRVVYWYDKQMWTLPTMVY